MGETPQVEQAVHWLRRGYRLGALVDAAAAIGMAAPALYGPTLRFDRPANDIRAVRSGYLSASGVRPVRGLQRAGRALRL